MGVGSGWGLGLGLGFGLGLKEGLRTWMASFGSFSTNCVTQ